MRTVEDGAVFVEGPMVAEDGSSESVESSRSVFESLLKPILGRAYRAAMSLTGSQADAEDLVQEAALAAYRRFETFTPGTNFKAWFLRILTNAFYMHTRRERRLASALELGATTESLPAAGSLGPAPTPAGVVGSRLAIEQIMQAIQTLPPDYRTVATLYFVEDMSYHDIAAILDCPIGTVRSRLHRGRRLLRAALWRIARDHGVV